MTKSNSDFEYHPAIMDKIQKAKKEAEEDELFTLDEALEFLKQHLHKHQLLNKQKQS